MTGRTSSRSYRVMLDSRSSLPWWTWVTGDEAFGGVVFVVLVVFVLALFIPAVLTIMVHHKICP